MSNEGVAEDFCDAKLDSINFNKVKGNRFAITDDYKLEEKDTIQFEVSLVQCVSNRAAILTDSSQPSGLSSWL